MPSTTTLTILHLTLWSQLGVLVRIYLDVFFSNGCSGGWGVCLLSKDLASNMLGSFIMGALINGTTPKKPLKILPSNHTWQDASELHVGARTGFCGSLTTFASWQLSLIEILIGGKGYQGGQWAEFLWGQIIGLQLSLSSYMFGQYACQVVDTLASGNMSLLSLQERPSKSSQGSGDPPRNEGSTAAGGTSKPHVKTHTAAGVLLLLLSALWIVLAILDTIPQHAARRQQWFALLFAPFGAIMRWQLSRLNGKLPWAVWLPAGTLLANLLACGIDFGLQAALQRMHDPSYWVTLLFAAVRVGFSGALSTVSTFVQEVYKLSEAEHTALRGFWYAGGSISLATLLGVVVYGWSLWA